MNEFSERYKSLSNADLLKIIDKSNDYQPLAVQAAKDELANRNLSKQDIDFANNENREERLQQENKIIERRKQVSVVKQRINDIIAQFNPILKELPTPAKVIRIVAIGFAILFFFKLIKEFRLLMWMFTDSAAQWDLTMFFYFFPLLILPFAIVLFWIRKQSGWILLSIYLSYTLIGIIYVFISEICSKSLTGLEWLDNLFPRTPLINYLPGFLIFAVTFWAIMKKDIREIYLIDAKKIWITVGIGGLFSYISFAIL